ncbi:unnamed protein product, partial [Brassica oleracea var. botrytis]
MEPTGNSTVSSDRKPIKKTVASSTTAKPNGKSTTSSAIVMKPNEKTDVSSANPMNPNAITALPSAHGDQVMLFRDVSLGPREAELMFPGSVYKLSNFFGSRSKVQYRVADHSATVSFTWNSALNVLENPPVLIPEDRFRFHSYEEFKANCDSKGDLYNYVGHMKLVNGQTVTEHTVLDEIDIAEKRHLCVHVQTHDEPVMKLYLWDKAATDFCQKFKLYGSTPSVLLVTTVNPKHLGAFKVAWFECTAIIDDVVQGSAWYYISCGGCNSKAVKGHTSLICNNKKCVIREVTGVAQYLTRISVYDKSEQAVLSFLTNEGVGVDACVSVPQALLDTIGQTHKFIVKVSDHNLTGKTQTITVTKILPPEVPFQHHLMVFRRLGVINLALKMLLLIGLQKPLRFLSQTKPSVPRV